MLLEILRTRRKAALPVFRKQKQHYPDECAYQDEMAYRIGTVREVYARGCMLEKDNLISVRGK